MPGTIPATSQLDRLISMTAINVLAGSRVMRDRLKSFNVCMGSSIGSQRTMDAISTPPPHSIFHHGIRGRGGTIFEAALPLDKGQVQADMRPHLIHRPARDIFPRLGGSRVFSYRIDLTCPSCRCGFPGPAELGAINPYAVHDDGQPTGQGDDRLLHPAAPGDLHSPGLEPGPFLRMQHALSSFVEHHPHHLVAAARYSAAPIDLA